MPEQPRRFIRNEADREPAAAVRSILAQAVAAVADRLGGMEGRRIEPDDLCQELTAALSTAPWPRGDLRVRRDRTRGPAKPGGAWRFDVLIERPDGVLAVIDVCDRDCGSESRADAWARLRLARARGIAESAFLVAAVQAETNLHGSSAASDQGSAEAGSPLAVAEVEAAPLPGWALVLWEVPAAPPES